MENKHSLNGSKVLLCMDFDHTIVDADSNEEVRAMVQGGEVAIPPEVRQIDTLQGWPEYMGAIFKLLHKQGIREREYRNQLERLPFAPGMQQFLETAMSDSNVELALISDANSLFIRWIMDAKGFGPERVPASNIFSNPARFDDDGSLLINPYHNQTSCELSSKHLCKGQVMHDFMKKREREIGSKFARIVYVGDGKNDLCPASRLKTDDAICARNGFQLAELLQASETASTKLPIEAHTVFYSEGTDLIDTLRGRMANRAS